ncbi:hypothetical protein [Candidatus Synchoanobacter obligatus]|uniref:Uncharacterized protein n=1 Tax=Candidatus Synchoanobacter obligatus TaxID=2919597 RepID=A0ABT1L450_9GAMM|nr:hypothetical protein [Candidatus Synchoanobacter obligatus]MCP8351889.1 hypothetical protein [Candidatus Synchoanobacter obligatus]
MNEEQRLKNRAEIDQKITELPLPSPLTPLPHTTKDVDAILALIPHVELFSGPYRGYLIDHVCIMDFSESIGLNMPFYQPYIFENFPNVLTANATGKELLSCTPLEQQSYGSIHETLMNYQKTGTLVHQHLQVKTPKESSCCSTILQALCRFFDDKHEIKEQLMAASSALFKGHAKDALKLAANINMAWLYLSPNSHIYRAYYYNILGLAHLMQVDHSIHTLKLVLRYFKTAVDADVLPIFALNYYQLLTTCGLEHTCDAISLKAYFKSHHETTWYIAGLDAKGEELKGLRFDR